MKKLIAILCIAACLLSLLAGCSDKQAAKPENGESAASHTKNTDAPGKTEDEKEDEPTPAASTEDDPDAARKKRDQAVLDSAVIYLTGAQTWNSEDLDLDTLSESGKTTVITLFLTAQLYETDESTWIREYMDMRSPAFIFHDGTEFQLKSFNQVTGIDWYNRETKLVTAAFIYCLDGEYDATALTVRVSGSYTDAEREIEAEIRPGEEIDSDRICVIDGRPYVCGAEGIPGYMNEPIVFVALDSNPFVTITNEDVSYEVTDGYTYDTDRYTVEVGRYGYLNTSIYGSTVYKDGVTRRIWKTPVTCEINFVYTSEEFEAHHDEDGYTPDEWWEEMNGKTKEIAQHIRVHICDNVWDVGTGVIKKAE